MYHTIEVSTRILKDYHIHIGNGIGDRIATFIDSRYSGRLGLAVVDEKVASLHRGRIRDTLHPRFDKLEWFEVPEGERSKSVGLWNKIVDFALKSGVERTTPLFAIGGGVTGDVAGFAASATLRGIPLVHLPTSLLAMVDSSIGGKTGINHAEGKNLVGAFYQPDAVFSDVRFLETLDRREWINGLSEIIKYGAIREPGILDTAAQLLEGPGFAPTDAWAQLIAQCASIKTEIVNEDTLEAGTRAYLNFGHTFGHALENVAGYGAVSHGQAVFIGMVAAAHASRSRGAAIEEARYDRFKSLYPLQLNKLVGDRQELVEAMKQDKKVKEGDIRLVLLEDWGRPYLHACEDNRLIEEAWDFAFDTFN